MTAGVAECVGTGYMATYLVDLALAASTSAEKILLKVCVMSYKHWNCNKKFCSHINDSIQPLVRFFTRYYNLEGI